MPARRALGIAVIALTLSSFGAFGQQVPYPICPPGSDAPCVGCTFEPCSPNACMGPGTGSHGTGEWLNWCVDATSNFPSEPGGVRLMHHNASALRTKGLPNGCDDGVCPPKHTTNSHSMDCELLFPQSWLTPNASGGQHLCGYGLAPYCTTDGMEATQGIQVDVSALSTSFGNGLRIHMEGWSCPPGQICDAPLCPAGELFINYDYAYGFTNAWTTFKLSVDYNPTTGVISGTVQVGGSPVGNFSGTTYTNLTPKLGNAIFWGNVNNRPDGDYLRMRNLNYW